MNIPAILDAIKKTGAQAVHPGYGFLSEKAHFAEELEKRGIAFIGPTSSAIHAMGDKIESKKLATKAKVHVIPGKLTDVERVEDAIAMAREITYPVMIKASAGGGGKGMRIAWNDQEFVENFKMAKDEAAAVFGDDRVLIEKYIDNPRHIEIQVLSDGKGNTIYVNERECSIQRRNQKVLEEAPSSFIDPETRKAMGQQACQLADAVGYRSAGTCEFLVDSNKYFYFLEMNTRLQVEHPISEYISGIDLVEWMIRIAAGEKLTVKQSDIGINGWAMEARVYAEDPLRNFLPSIGYLDKYQEPDTKDGSVRVDAGVEEGGEISIHYDPLISKLITHGKTREESIEKLKKALDTYVIRGVNHNVPFLRSVLENNRYVSGNISTKFIPEEYPNGFKGHILNEQHTDELVSSSAVMNYLRKQRDFSISGKITDNVEYPQQQEYVIVADEKEYNIVISKLDNDNEFTVTINGKEHNVTVDWPVDTTLFHAVVDGKSVTLQVMINTTLGFKLQHYGSQYDVLVQTPLQHKLAKFMPVKEKVDTSKFISSPMPGRIISVGKVAGDKVVLGEGLVVMEAMKMRNILRAERDGIIKKVNVKEGDNVPVDTVLIEFE